MALSFKDKQEIKKHFDSFDNDGDGHVTVDEVGKVLESIGEQVNDQRIKSLIAEVDLDQNGTIEFNEFCKFVEKLRSGKVAADKGFGEVVTKNANLNVVASTFAQHSFSDEEKASFVDYINDCLRNDPDCKHLGLPLNPDSMDLFKACRDGILICKLINASIKGTIDERAINKGSNLNTFKITENQNLCINSAKAIGCNVVNIGAKDLMEGKVHLILGLIWQIIRIGLLASINLKNHPYLVRLLEPGETLEDLLKLSPEQILLRWVNYHLKNAGSPKRIKNFSGDIKDSEAYTILLNQLAPKKCDKSALNEANPLKRADMVLNNAAKIDCRKFVRPRDIVAGNPKLNLAFVANMFNTCPGLEPVAEEEVVEVEEETREEKAFRNWMNSLGVDPYVNNLYEDLRDGLILLQVLDKIEPGVVDWSKVNKTKPLNKFKQVENCNYAVVIGKQIKFSLVGVAGSDIQAGNKKLTLAVVWQAMRYFVLHFLKNMSKNGREINEGEIIQWCNQKVRDGGKSSSMDSFKDKSLSDSVFIMDLLYACQPESVNYDLLTPGKSDEEKMMNAQYAISCARKMGCAVFLLWEDIVEVKDKLMLTFFGTVMGQFGNR
jgi:hypothetical protein